MAYTQEQLEKIAERGKDWTPELQAEVEADWRTIFADAKRLSDAGADPDSEEAQATDQFVRHMMTAYRSR